MAEPFERALDELARGPLHTTPRPGRGRREPADPASHPSVAALRERFGDAVLHHEVVAGDEHVVYLRPDSSRAVLAWLKDDPDHDYQFLSDLTAVDFGGGRPLQVVYQLWSLTHRRQLRVKVELPLDALEIETVVPLWRTADWLEREVYDMFGIHFTGHPDLRRILMPENYAEGHPLRKDFPLRGRFSRAEQTRRALAWDLEDYYVPTELEVLTPRDWERAAREGAAPGQGSAPPPEPAPSDDEEATS